MSIDNLRKMLNSLENDPDVPTYKPSNYFVEKSKNVPQGDFFKEKWARDVLAAKVKAQQDEEQNKRRTALENDNAYQTTPYWSPEEEKQFNEASVSNKKKSVDAKISQWEKDVKSLDVLEYNSPEWTAKHTELEKRKNDLSNEYNSIEDIMKGSKYYAQRGQEYSKVPSTDYQKLDRINEISNIISNVNGNGEADVRALTDESNKLMNSLSKGYDVTKMLEYRQRVVNEQEAAKQSRQARQLASDNPLAANVASVGSNALGYMGFLSGIGQNIGNAITGDYVPIDTNSAAFSPTRFTNDIRSQTNENINNPLGQLLYNAGMSTADFALQAPMGNFGLAMMSTNAASSAMQSAIDNGADNDQAMWSGLLAGAAEFVSEKISLDQLGAFKASNNIKGIKDVIGNVAKAFVVEGSEESATDVANLITDNLINGKYSNSNTSIQNYMDQGMTEEEAKSKASGDFWMQMANDFLVGGLSGGVMGGAVSGINLASRNSALNSEGKSVSSSNGTDQLMKFALATADQNSNVYKNAESIQNGGNVQNKSVGDVSIESKKYIQKYLNSASSAEDLDNRYQTIINTVPESLKDFTAQAYRAASEIGTQIGYNETESKPNDKLLELAMKSAGVSTHPTGLQNVSNAQEPNITAKPQSLAVEPTISRSNAPIAEYNPTEENPHKFVRVQSGKVMIDTGNTEGTQYVNADRLSYADPNVETVVKAAQNLDEVGANAMVENRIPGVPAQAYVSAFDGVYRQGLMNTPKDTIQMPPAFKDHENLLDIAYAAGTKDASADTARRSINAPQAKARYRANRKGGLVQNEYSAKLNDGESGFIDSIAKSMGVEVEIVPSIGKGKASANGYYKDGKIFIAYDADRIASVVAKHEFTHAMQELVPKEYAAYRDFVMRELNREEPETVNNLIKKKIAEYKDAHMQISEQEAMDEVVADASEKFLTDPESIDRLISENKELGEKIRDIIRDIIAKLQSVLENYKAVTTEGKMLSDNLDAFKEAESLWVAALNEASAEQNETINPDDYEEIPVDGKFSLKDSDGNELSKEQAEFFKDSKVRDADGNLLVVYHGTKNDFTVFEPSKGGEFGGGIYFSDNKETAMSYAKYVSRGDKESRVIASYVNMTNPYTISKTDYIKKTERTDPKTLKNRLISQGYDGIIGIGLNGYDKQYIAFYPEQIKSVENVKPTENADIRYSFKDSEYLELAKDPEKNKAQLQNMVDEAAKGAGYTDKFYHGTKHFGFTVFNSEESDDKLSFFAASSQDVAQSYSGRTGVKPISETGKNVESMPLQDVVNKLNEESQNDANEMQSKYYVMNLEDSNALIQNVNSGIDELKLVVKDKLSEYDEKIKKSHDGEDVKTYTLLKQLQSKLAQNAYGELSTPIYLLLHYRDAFDRSKKIGELEKNIRLMNKIKGIDLFDGVVVKESLEGYTIDILSEKQAKEELSKASKEGNYALYGNPGNQMVINGHGENWDHILTWLHPTVKNTVTAAVESDELVLKDKKGAFYREKLATIKEMKPGIDAAITERYGNMIADSISGQISDGLRNSASVSVGVKARGLYSTREIAKFAKDNGYDSVKIENIKDNGGRGKEVPSGDIYIYFNPNNLKSADPVAYDEKGNIISLSERFNSENADIRYSLKDNFGYHAGDLGKSESLGNQSGGRGTGHFGTGTYFVGDKSKIEIGGYKERPVEMVDFSKYELFRPKNFDDGMDLHEFLKGVNNFMGRNESAPKTYRELEYASEDASELLYEYEASEGKDIEKAKQFLSIARNIIGTYNVSNSLLKLVGNDSNVFNGIDSDGKIVQFLPNNEYKELSEDELLKIIGDNLWRALEDISSQFKDNFTVSSITHFEDWNDDIPKAARILNVSEKELRDSIKQAYKEISDANYDTDESYRQDSASTRVMKSLGYEGVDVRGINGLDDTKYGSVIYDLKAEDIQRKSEIGTARFSLKGSSEIPADYKAAIQENEKLRQMVETLKKEFQLTSGHVIDPKKLRKFSESILKSYNSDYSVDDLTSNLQKAFDYLTNTYENDPFDAFLYSVYIGEEILKQSKNSLFSIGDDYPNLRDYLRKQKIYISTEAKAEIVAQYGSYKNFRESYRSLHFTQNPKGALGADVIMQEISEQAPFLAGKHESMSANDMAITIAEIYQMLAPQYESLSADEIVEYSTQIAADIYDGYFDLPEVKTFADKKKQELDKQRVSYKNQMKNLRASMNRKIDDLKNQKAELRSKMTVDKNEALAKQKERYQTMIKEATARRQEAAKKRHYRIQIEDIAKDMMKMSLSPKGKRSIYSAFIGDISGVLQSIDFTRIVKGEPTKKAENWNNQLRKLGAKVDEILDRGSDLTDVYGDFYLHISPDLTQRIRKLAADASAGNYSIADMDSEQLKQLSDILKELRHAVFVENEIISGERKSEAHFNGEETIEELKRGREKIVRGRQYGAATNSFFHFDMLNSVTFAHELGNGGETIIRNLDKGNDKRIFLVDQASKKYAELLKKHKLTPKEVYGKDSKRFTFTMENGETLNLNVPQIMVLYALSRRPQAMKHILGQGIRSDNLYGKELKVNPIVHVTQADLDNVFNTLTANQKGFAEDIQSYLSTEVARWGNVASMEMFGVMKFLESFYFPIRSDPFATMRTEAIQEKTGTEIVNHIKNLGMAQETLDNASNPILIGDLSEIFAQHIEDMATYATMLKPLTDALTWYYHKQVDENGRYKTSVAEEMTKAFGANANKFFKNLIFDVNKMDRMKSSNPLLDMIIRKVKIVQVAANLRVIVQQPTSFIRAAMVMNEKYLAKAYTKKPQFEKATTYCAPAIAKTWGYFDMNIGKSMLEVITGMEGNLDKVRNLMLKPAQLADELTWGYLWNACEFEILDKTNLKYGTEEFNKAVGERLAEVIKQTQVYDSIFTRPQIMRDSNGMAKMVTMFMSESLLNYNKMHEAWYDWWNPRKVDRTKEEATEAWQKFAKYALVFIILQGVVSAASAIVDGIRDDDKYKSFWDKILENFGSNVVDNMLPTSMIPVVRDVVSMAKGYTITRPDAQIYKYIFKAGNDIANGAKPMTAAMDIAQALSLITGIPAYNILRDAKGITDTILIAMGGDPVGGYDTTTKNIVTALESNNVNTANRAAADLIKDGKDAGDIKSGLSSYYKSRYIGANTAQKAEIIKKLTSVKVNGIPVYSQKDFQNWNKDEAKQKTESSK